MGNSSCNGAAYDDGKIETMSTEAAALPTGQRSQELIQEVTLVG